MLGNLFSTFRPNGVGQGFSPFCMMRGMTPQPSEQDKRPSYPPLNPKTIYTKIFLWMAAGLALSTIAGFALAAVLSPASLIESLTSDGAVPTFRFMWFMPIFVLLQLVLGLGCSFFFYKMNYGMLIIFFVLYSLANGMTLSSIFIGYDAFSIIAALGITAVMFGAMCLIGLLTKRDLSSLGSIVIMASIGFVIASIVGMFAAHPLVTWITSLVGVVLFSGMTILSINGIKTTLERNNGHMSEQDANKFVLQSAFHLYLDIINLFITLIQLFSRRDSLRY